MREHDYMSLIMFLFFILVPSAEPSTFVPPPVLKSDQDINSWTCSYHQKVWMRTELQSLGLWPGSHHMIKPGNASPSTARAHRYCVNSPITELLSAPSILHLETRE